MTRNEAIESLRQLYSDANAENKAALESLIPELKESEDEGIRKALLRCCDEWEKGQFGCMAKEDIPAIRAYLEKQKEQNPIKMEVYEVGKGTTICGQDYKCKKDYKEGNCWYIKDAIYHCGRDGYLTDQNGISWSCTPEWFKEYIYSNTEWAEEEKRDFVSGQFVQCNCNLDNGLTKGKHYWFEYIGDDTYIGRSDNILNRKFHITPRQLFTQFSQELEEEVQCPPQQEERVLLTDEPTMFNENPSAEEIINALIHYFTESDGILTAIDCVSTKSILNWLEKQKEQNKCPEYCVRSHCIGCPIYEKQKEQKPADNISREEYVKRFKALCDAYEIKLPNREYDIYHLCDDLSKLFTDSGKQKPTEMDNEEIELSDFESELFSAFSDGWQQYLRGEEVNVVQWAKEHSAQLLNVAKQELKPTEWSKEDKNRHYYLCNLLRETWDKIDKGSCIDDAITWLEELPERIIPHSWRPSKEQIEALEHFIRSWGESGTMSPQNPILYAAKTLLNDLKKL